MATNPIAPTKPLKMPIRLLHSDGTPIDPSTHQVRIVVQVPNGDKVELLSPDIMGSGVDGFVLIEIDVMHRGNYTVGGIITYPDGAQVPLREWGFHADGPSIAALP